jgi:hypothetical protein
MLTLWILSLDYQCLTIEQASWSIELEEYHSSPTNKGETNNDSVFKDEMLTPAHLAWVEQGHKSVTEGVKGGEIGAFRTVARQTGHCQIVSLRWPTMFQSNNMINLMAIDRNVLVDQAVLTPLSRSLKHEVPQRRRD